MNTDSVVDTSVPNARTHGSNLSERKPSPSRLTTEPAFSNASTRDEFVLLMFKEDANARYCHQLWETSRYSDYSLGSQIIGMKYPNACTVLASSKTRNPGCESHHETCSFKLPQILSLRFSRIEPRCTVLVLTGALSTLRSGTLGLIQINPGTSPTPIPTPRNLKVTLDPYLCKRGGRINGKNTPPTAVPANMLPFARPRRERNHVGK